MRYPSTQTDELSEAIRSRWDDNHFNSSVSRIAYFIEDHTNQAVEAALTEILKYKQEIRPPWLNDDKSIDGVYTYGVEVEHIEKMLSTLSTNKSNHTGENNE